MQKYGNKSNVSWVRLTSLMSKLDIILTTFICRLKFLSIRVEFPYSAVCHNQRINNTPLETSAVNVLIKYFEIFFLQKLYV